ncbi:sphingosine kinase 2-like isoform X1 [Saccostrea echinata]|uniref:sphingosine kinase 2-like isoform X1 n=1 Tax=Saccostrea echinata TaxID=191078 RepID=UPI002A7F2438|nr:sphingosine kinase 2-like isoform X1 [Saccostrea echinata]
MEHNDILLQGKFSILGKPGKVCIVELTSEKLQFQDLSCKTNDCEGVIDIRDVIGCRINTGVNKQGSRNMCNCVKSHVVWDMAECLLSIHYCPKTKKKLFCKSYYRQHCTLTLALAQHPDYDSNKIVCEKWKKTILSLSKNNNNHITIETDLENCEAPLQRKILVLINPFSGPGKARQIFENGVSSMLEEADISFKMVITEYAGHATEMMRSLDLSAWYGVVIVSGDGLIYEVINGLMSRADWEVAINFPVGCLPGGSGNALSLNINYQAGEPVDLNPILHSTFVLIKHRVIPMDLVLVQIPGKQMYSFLSVTWGLVADIDYESERLRVLGASRFTLYFIKRVVSLRKYRAKVSFLPVTPYEPGAKNQKERAVKCSRPRRFTMIRNSTTQRNISSSVYEGGVQGVYTEKSSSHSLPRLRSKSMPAVKTISETNGDISGYEEHDNVMFELDDSDECFTSSLPNGDHVKDDNVSTESENIFEEMVHTLNNDGKPLQAPLLAPLEEEVPSNWVTIEDEFITACALYQPYLGPDNLASPESRLNDGQIHLLIIRAGIPKSALVNLFLSFETGDHISSPYVEMIKVLAFRLEPMGTEGNIMVDGEHVDYGPIQGQVLPGIARIMGVQ